MGKRFISFFAQDSWKVTRKLTLDYGLRYDYFTHPTEQYGRQPSLSPSVPNPTAGGFSGGIIYEATCNCSFAKDYRYAFGPRFGLSYQFLEKTVLRMGIGIAYDGTATGATEQRLQCARLRHRIHDALQRSALGVRSAVAKFFRWGFSKSQLPGKSEWSAERGRSERGPSGAAGPVERLNTA